MEYRDLYDENKNLTDQKIEKGEEVPKGLYYVTVVVFIKDSRNCFLLQINKKYNLWGATGGHPKSGEDSITGIITEIREELGYPVELINTGVTVAKKLSDYLKANNLVNDNQQNEDLIFLTKPEESFKEIAKKLLGIDVKIR